jgi:hypothetical protein
MLFFRLKKQNIYIEVLLYSFFFGSLLLLWAMKPAFDGLKGSEYNTRDTSIDDVGRFDSVLDSYARWEFLETCAL